MRADKLVKNYVLYFYYHKKTLYRYIGALFTTVVEKRGIPSSYDSRKNREWDDYEVAILKVKDINHTFETIVDKVTVEIIDENQDSIIEMAIELK